MHSMFNKICTRLCCDLAMRRVLATCNLCDLYTHILPYNRPIASEVILKDVPTPNKMQQCVTLCVFLGINCQTSRVMSKIQWQALLYDVLILHRIVKIQDAAQLLRAFPLRTPNWTVQTVQQWSNHDKHSTPLDKRTTPGTWCRCGSFSASYRRSSDNRHCRYLNHPDRLAKVYYRSYVKKKQQTDG